MEKGGNRLIDDGDNCGASFIEKTIYKQQKEKDEVIQNFEKQYPRLVDCLLFEARKVKEQVYFDPTSKVRKTINLDDIVEDDEDFEDERFKLVFQPGELNGLLESVGIFEKLKKLFVILGDIRFIMRPYMGYSLQEVLLVWIL